MSWAFYESVKKKLLGRSRFYRRVLREVSRINEVAARQTDLLQSSAAICRHNTGGLALMFMLQEWLKEITGFAAASYSPALRGINCGLIMRAYHHERGDDSR